MPGNGEGCVNRRLSDRERGNRQRRANAIERPRMIGSKWIAILAAGLALAGCGGGGKGGNAQSAGGGTGSAGRTGGSGGSVQSPGGAAQSGGPKCDQTKIAAAIPSYTAAIA